MAVQPAPPTLNGTLYNDGNDDLASMNRFAFPSISFSPSFPLDMSPGISRPSSAMLAPSPPNTGALNVLSPRSAHRGGSASGTGSGVVNGGSILPHSTSPGPNPNSSSNQLPSYFSPATSNESGGLLSANSFSNSLDSPLPPLSPRGQKLADAASYHNAKCLNRIVEKRRKASDGTEDIVIHERAPMLHNHNRKVSFREEDTENARCGSLPQRLQDGSYNKEIDSSLLTTKASVDED